jgi:signal peptidase I
MSASLSNNTEPELPCGRPEEAAEPGLLLEVWDWMKAIVVAMVVLVFIHQYLFYPSTVKGSSMEPTLREGQWLFINKMIRYTGTPARGDIVVIKDPAGADSPHPFLVKRVVAVAGDEVFIRNGKLYVNGVEAKETYIDSKIEDGWFEPFYVGEQHLFVMGDNRHRDKSLDSRSFGAVSVTQVEGRAEWIIWPISNWRSL